VSEIVGILRLDRPSQFGCTAASSTASHSLLASTSEINECRAATGEQWHAVRVGLAGDVTLTDRLKWQAEGAWLPYMSFSGQDNHWLRPNINPVIERGHGSNRQILWPRSQGIFDRLGLQRRARPVEESAVVTHFRRGPGRRAAP
jgi:hypothetical protein